LFIPLAIREYGGDYQCLRRTFQPSLG